ncbi:ExeM/NucH family extracellular endonuclease [Alteromonas sp. KUL49]|uniref:ExeM/NucH family extracellular endonuclease n=1 Tax=Alteromonas sp. KUL49 TaxID=2480798 RepID=UPI00102F18BC|nr:ExeM/NucH family extracellular endonuclease [Alteromonas sp. KUL49]TAP34505.1 ExeM/NucH family extracellular endonuclease [Alteromonas sp. KUL49]GEA13557.1 hypothetical protein KUL49_39320 [Alteromonas sp. KUL49]
MLQTDKRLGSLSPLLTRKGKVAKATLGFILALPIAFTASGAVVWEENFDSAEGKGATGSSAGVTLDMTGITAWSIDVSGAQLTATSDWFKVVSGQLEARDVDGDAIWESESIDISQSSALSLEVEASEVDTQESTDYLDVLYSVDGGEFILVTHPNGTDSHTLVDDFTAVTVTSDIPDGSTLVVRIVMKNAASAEKHRVDSVVVNGTASTGGGDGGDDGSGGNGDPEPDTYRTVVNPCYNCPDLTAVALLADYDAATYYATLDAAIANNESADNLKSIAQNIISTGHNVLSYSEVWSGLTQTDEDPTDTDNIILFYKGTALAKFSNGSGDQSSDPDNWNREHTWASSHGFSSSTYTAYTDIHHLRPTDISVNSSRGNLDFDNGGSALSEAPSNLIDGDSFEPRDAVKGDVARALFYMDTRYDGSDGTEDDLSLVNRLTSTSEASHGVLCTLLTWHEEDPVDTFESDRNNTVYEFQGNRNPFIDKPELVALVFNSDCDGSTQDPGDGDTDGGSGDGTGDGSSGDSGAVAPSGNELFISEYIEGSSFNKAIEIFNASADTIDLTGYALKLYSNGATSTTKVIDLTGTLASGAVITFAHGSADTILTTGSITDNTVINFNGDDYLELTFNDTVVDALGTYGVKSSWGANVTLVRKSSVTQGNPTRDASFSYTNEWDNYASNTFDYFGAHSGSVSDPTDPVSDPKLTLISTIQGNGTSSPLVGTDVIIEAVVTLVTPDLNGFFVQEEASDSDGDAMTSEGVFVYDASLTDFPTLGDTVSFIGEVTEYNDLTEILLGSEITFVRNGDYILDQVITMPFDEAVDLEAYEGMIVRSTQSLVVTDTYDLGRYGQFTVSSERLMIPTNQYVASSADALALATANSQNTLIIDDGSSAQNLDNLPFPVGGLSHTNTLRLGDSVVNLEGVLHYSFGAYSVIPTQSINSVRTNPRISQPLLLTNGDVTVASFNVLNYFNGPSFPTSRGASSASELSRQQDKIVAALVEINADVIGLVELENDGYESDSAIATLTDALNSELGSNEYAFVTPPSTVLGGDEIAVGILYKPAVVSLDGSAITLSESPFDDGNRQPLIQSFIVNSNEESFALAVNHFKSKGSCSSATGNNADSGDGQGCWNELRTQAATGLQALITDNLATLGDRVLVMGDLNAYAMEEPILSFTDNGYTNLVNTFVGDGAYSYSFGGEIGYLDHALSTSTLLDYVVDA